MDACFVDVTAEFLAVAFHNILYYTTVYPRSIFVPRKKYGVVVYRCIHPEVNEYMDMCMKTLSESLKTGQLRRVELAVTDERYTPVLKYVFHFDHFAAFDETEDAYLVRCEQNFRAFFLQLATVTQKINNLPVDTSFSIYFYTNESNEVSLANIPELEVFPLVEAGQELEKFNCIMPLKRFSIRNYNIDTYIELPKSD